MSNFIETFKEGELGLNQGLSTGLRVLDIAINGLQKKTSIGLAAAQKVGKTALADYCFLISPYMYMLKHGRLDDIEWIYWSFEIDRVSKEYKIAALFMFMDFGVWDFEYKGVKYLMSHNYLMSKQLHANKDGSLEIVRVTPEHKEMLREIYTRRIVPIFGEYDKNNHQITPGKVTFMENLDNPTGMRNHLLAHFKKHGIIEVEKFKTHDEKGRDVMREKIIGYVENNSKKYTIGITDHMRKPTRERGFTMKENIDKWLEYSTEAVNKFYATMINIAHSNRGIANIERLKFMGDTIFPTADDVKDTGNLAEESHILLTMFNPNDEKYNLSSHFGTDITNRQNPNYRSLHVADARWVESPQHMKLNMYGNINYFEPFKTKTQSNA